MTLHLLISWHFRVPSSTDSCPTTLTQSHFPALRQGCQLTRVNLLSCSMQTIRSRQRRTNPSCTACKAPHKPVMEASSTTKHPLVSRPSRTVTSPACSQAARLPPPPAETAPCSAVQQPATSWIWQDFYVPDGGKPFTALKPCPSLWGSPPALDPLLPHTAALPRHAKPTDSCLTQLPMKTMHFNSSSI